MTRRKSARVVPFRRPARKKRRAGRLAGSLLWVVMAVAFTWLVISLDGVTGRVVHLRDGDSFVLGDREIRLFGIDAPELHQTCRDETGATWPCGRVARARLRALLAKGEVSCRPIERDRYEREVAVCRAGENDPAAVLVAEGLAVTYGASPYLSEERAARRRHRGLWRGEFEMPEQWRRRHGRDAVK